MLYVIKDQELQSQILNACDYSEWMTEAGLYFPKVMTLPHWAQHHPLATASLCFFGNDSRTFLFWTSYSSLTVRIKKTKNMDDKDFHYSSQEGFQSSLRGRINLNAYEVLHILTFLVHVNYNIVKLHNWKKSFKNSRNCHEISKF